MSDQTTIEIIGKEWHRFSQNLGHIRGKKGLKARIYKESKAIYRTQHSHGHRNGIENCAETLFASSQRFAVCLAFGYVVKKYEPAVNVVVLSVQRRDQNVVKT